MNIQASPHAQPKHIDSAPRDGGTIYVIDVDSHAIFEATWDGTGDSLINGVLVSTGTWICTVGGWMEQGEVMAWLTKDEVHITP